MASTRKQKQKNRALCMTDFYANSDQTDRADPLSTPLRLASPPPRTSTDDTSEVPFPSSSPSTSPPSQEPPHIPGRSHGLKRGSSIPVSARYASTSSPQGDMGASSNSNSPTSQSPSKHKAKLDMELGDSQSQQGITITSAPRSEDLLDNLPTTNQAASEPFIKEMMLALRSSLQQSFTEALNRQMTVIDGLGERVAHVENKMGEFSEAHNSLVDAHNNLEEDMATLANKLADLEDRNRRNNVKFRGVPESVPPSELTSYIQHLIKSVLPAVTTHDLIIDRAHRLPKPKGLPEATPRDVIARIHFYHVKDELMQVARKLPQLPEPFRQIHLYADLSQATLQARKRLQPITAALRQYSTNGASRPKFSLIEMA